METQIYILKFIVAHGKTFEIKLDNKYEKKLF